MLAGFKISNLGGLIKKYRALICYGYTVSVYTGMCHLCSQPVKNILTRSVELHDIVMRSFTISTKI